MEARKILLHVQWKAEGREIEQYDCVTLGEAYERIDALMENDSVHGFQLSVDCATGAGKPPNLTGVSRLLRKGLAERLPDLQIMDQFPAMEMPAPCFGCEKVFELNSLMSCSDGNVRCGACKRRWEDGDWL